MIAHMICLSAEEDLSDLAPSTVNNGKYFDYEYIRGKWDIINKGPGLCWWLLLAIDVNTGAYEILDRRRRN